MGAMIPRGMATTMAVRGSGVGLRLLDACVDHVSQSGGMLLWCNARITAQGFYERAGFHAEGDPFELPEIGTHILMLRALSD